MSKAQWFFIGISAGSVILVSMAARYQVGAPVPAGVYTEQFQPDGIYKFCQVSFDPNKPKQLQAAPDDWVRTFGNNERTLILYNISELRATVAIQNRRLNSLEELAKPEGMTVDCPRNDPNGADCGGCHK